MTTVTTRAAKGSALTATEVDANFNNLKSAVDAAAALYNPAAVAITGGALDGLQRVGFSAVAGGASDVLLQRDAANRLAQRNGVNPQAFNLYGTYTDASNWERFGVDFSAGAYVVMGAQAGGTGTQRPVFFDGLYLMLSAAGTNQVFIGSGVMRPNTNGQVALGQSGAGFKQLFIDYANTATVGAVTINKAAGRVNIAAGGTSLVVTNSLVTAESKVFAQVSKADGTAYIKNVVPTAGSFTITLGAAATAQTSIDFFVVNAD